MSEEKEVGVKVKTSKTGTGFEDTAAAARKTKKAAEETTHAFHDLGTQAHRLKDQLAELATFAVIIEQFREGWQESQMLAREFKMLEMAAKRTGDSFPEVKKEVIELAEEFKQASGVADEMSIPAINKLYREYGNMKDATNAARLAQAIAATEGKTFAEGIEIVHMAAVGQTRALKQMGIVIEDASGAGMKGAEALKALGERARTATVDHSSLSYQTKRLSAEYDDFRLKVVDAVKEVLPAAVSIGKTVFISLRTVYGELSTIVQGGIQLVVDAWGVIKKIGQGESAEQIGASFKTMMTNLKGVGKEIVDIHHKGAGDITKAWAKSGRDIVQLGKDLVLPAALKEAKTKKEINKEFIESDWKAWLANEERKEKALNKYHKNLAKMREETTEDMLRHFGIEYSAEEEMREKTQALAKEMTKRKKELAEQEVQMSVDVANAAIGLASDLFGSSKETAIASAIINTYEGATKALAQGGVYGAVLAAIVIASGLAQIAKIESTEPATGSVSSGGSISGGFDDPTNDQMAYVTGRRWAKDVVEKLSGGWQEGLAASSVTTTHVDNSRRTTINANIQDPSNIESVKKLIRTIKMVDANTLGPTTIGPRTR